MCPGCLLRQAAKLDGSVIFIKSQDANGVTLQTANEVVTLPRSEIRKIEATAISMMPEGLIANLTEQQTRDLLYYLTRPGQVPLPVGAK